MSAEPGYLNALYAESLRDFGTPRRLTRAHAFILERDVPAAPARDAAGCYPLFCCRDWNVLADDLDDIGAELVSLVVVPDPFSADLENLRVAFPDFVRPFKDHFVVDAAREPSSFVTKHHRYYARKALRTVVVEPIASKSDFVRDWVSLYDCLTERRALHGLHRFSKRAFDLQLSVPGLVALRASVGPEIVGAHLWFIQNDVAYSHLAAYTPRGYELSVGYALHWTALHHFRGTVEWLDLGGGAGVNGGSDGLSFFKQGWATGTVAAFVCGKIFDKQRYGELVRHRGAERSTYFPAYRVGEFA
jgi:hypothetical protein